MALITFILILLLLNYSISKTCVIDNTPDHITWEKELFKDLDTNYSALHPPSENTTVNYTYFLQTFNYNDEKEVMTMQTRLIGNWQDERLKWDSEKYHGINEADVSHFYIWTPYFGLSNTDDFLDYYLNSYRYDLKSNGEVDCEHWLSQEARCSLKLTNWPYDLQECNYLFEPLEHSVSISSVYYAINFDFVVLGPKSAEWYIYDFKHVQDNTTKRQVKLTLFLMREAAGLSAIVIWPAFVLTVLSVLSLCLDVRRKVRLAVICLSLFGHFYFLTELSYDIPKECHFPPTLLLYYRGSVILSIIIVLSTFLLDTMCKLKSTPHNYVKLINDFVYENNYRTHLVFPRWDFDDATVDSKSSSEDWLKFANIVNSVFIFFIVFAYIGLYGTHIPKRTIYHDVNNDYMV